MVPPPSGSKQCNNRYTAIPQKTCLENIFHYPRFGLGALPSELKFLTILRHNKKHYSGKDVKGKLVLMPRHHATKPNGVMEVKLISAITSKQETLRPIVQVRYWMCCTACLDGVVLRMSKVAPSLGSHFSGFPTTCQLLKKGICV